MYEIGKVYVWQNLREYAHLNGTETTVTGPLEAFNYKHLPGVHFWYCETDTVLDDGWVLWASRNELRPKNPPVEQIEEVRECETQ